jgi:hypothetical protein
MGRFPSRQRGMTFFGFVWMMSLVGFFSLLVIKIGPLYLDHYKVVSSLESLKQDPELPSMNRQQVVAALDKYWEINMVTGATRDSVNLSRDQNGTRVEVVYDATTNVMGNLDVVIHFSDAIEVDAN